MVQKDFYVWRCLVGGEDALRSVMSHGVREGICVFEIVQPKALDEAMKVIIAFDVIAAKKNKAMRVDQVAHYGL